MAQYITKIRTESGDKQIDYNALANLPNLDAKANVSDLTSHTDNKSNPHGVTKDQIGLGNVSNTSDANKPVSNAQKTAIADAKKAGTDAQANLNTHINNKSNPHGVTAAQIGAAVSGHNHDDRYLRKYDLNAINIDSTGGNWTVDISESGHGSVPETWVNVTQTTSGHFFVQTAVKINKDTNTHRRAGRVWVREKYNGSEWSRWTDSYSNPSCSVKGSATSLSLPANTITKLTLDTIYTNDANFVCTNGGIKLPYTGYVLVSGSVYVKSSSSDVGVYVYLNGGAEVTSALLSARYNTTVGAPPVIIAVSAGDMLYLHARDVNGSSCIPDHKTTHLDVVYL